MERTPKCWTAYSAATGSPKKKKTKISIRKDQYFRDFFKPHVRLIKGLHHFLQQARDENIPLAIATGGLKDNIDFVLEKTGVRDFFSALVSEADVTNSKPDPQTFLVAAEQLKVPPADCVVFEDVPKGVQAAREAGMKAVVILTSHEKKDFAGFNNVITMVKDYHELSPSSLVKTG